MLFRSENLETQDDMIAQDNLIQTMVQGEAINVFAASGDCAAYSDSSGYPTNRTVGFPASDPYALAVGGTELSTNGAGNRTQETVWSGDPKKDPTCDNSWGSGGGISQNFQRPDWQQGPGVKNRYSNGQRQVPDVSAIADFIVMYANGQWIYSGGTSAATPIWTSALAMANEGLIAKTHYYTFGPDLIYWMAQHAANDHP